MKGNSLVNIVDPRLRALERVLRKWIRELKRYELAMNDVPWWYTERASVGMLAAAAVRLGWTALEEYSVEKGPRPVKDRKLTPEEKKVRHKGRCDLYLCDESGKIDFAIEAKQAWQSIQTDNEASQVVRQWQVVHDDANRLVKEEADLKVAAVFVVPYLRPGATETEVARSFRDLMVRLQASDKLRSLGAIAAYISPNHTSYVGIHGDIFPGCALALRAMGRKPA